MVSRIPKIVLLDLDDTILVFDALAEHAWESVIGRFVDRVENVTSAGLLKAITEENVRYWSDPDQHRIGRLNLDCAWKQIARAGLVSLGVYDCDMAQIMGSEYSLERDKCISFVPGAKETLIQLRELKVCMALITNGNTERQRDKISRFGLEEFFDYILIEGEFGIGKPDPSVFLHVLEQLNARPEDAWMVGDRLEFDMDTPKKLGIHTVWIDVSGDGLPVDALVRPDRVINSIADLLNDLEDQ